MRWNTFGRSLVFAGLAAFGLLLAASLPLGRGTLLSVYCVAAAVAYVVGLAPDARRGVRAGLVTAALGAGVLGLAGGPAQVAVGAALLVGVGRSVLLYRSPGARSLALEAVLVGGGLWMARWLLDGGLGSAALALWGFFLVQSLYFLVGGREERSDADAGTDPFERARASLARLLD